MRYLAQHEALPDLFDVENYSTEPASTYPNVVGSEAVPHQQLGCARLVQETVPQL